MAAGFRVFEGHGARAGAGSGIVAYRADPATMALSEIEGGTDELFGFPPEEWRRPGFWLERLHPDDREAAGEFCRSLRRQPRSHEAQYRFFDPDGRLRWLHDIVEVRGCDGGRAVRGVLVDITDRIAGEPDTGRAQRLRDELMRIVAGELARPLRAISGFAEMLGRHLSAQRDDLGSDHAIGIIEGVQRLDGLLARLMRVAQAEDATVDEMIDGLAQIRDPQPGTDRDQQT